MFVLVTVLEYSAVDKALLLACMPVSCSGVNIIELGCVMSFAPSLNVGT